MIIFPAIDLKDGQCVRLKKGEMDQATIFNDDPADQAQIFAKQGFQWVHIVDLNGAFAGEPVNKDAVKSIINAVDIPLQLGGGIRNLKTIDYWLNAGLKRIILGTIALTQPHIVKEACTSFPDQIVVGIDAKNGKVATEGWAETSEMTAIDLAKRFEDCGVTAIIYTDVNRDGLLGGPDIDGTKALAQAVNIPIIASGGIGSNEDIAAIKTLENDGVTGVITGRALYDGKINIQEALDVAC